MTYCSICCGPYPQGGGHRCPQFNNHDRVEIRTVGMKCGVCGSTAIDHTELNCQLNRTLNDVDKLTNPTPTEKEV